MPAPRSEKRKRTVLKGVRFMPDEEQQLAKAAADAGEKFGEYVRNAALARSLTTT